MSFIGGSARRSGKEFLEAGKKRLAGDTTREATAPEVQSMKSGNEALKHLVAEMSRFGGPTGVSAIKINSKLTTNLYYHMTQSEKMWGRPRCVL